MKEEKNYMDGIQSPVQKRSIKDIPVPPRKRVRTSNSSKSKTSLDLRKKTDDEEVEPREALRPIRDTASEESLDLSQNNLKRSYSEDDEDETEEAPVFAEPRRSNPNKNNPKKGKFWLITISGVVALFLIFAVFSSVFSKAKITITPKNQELTNLNVTIPIVDEKQGNSNLLSYKVLEISDSASKVVEAESEEDVENKASGVITVYNNYSTEPQRLIQNTRFETPEGLIYRIQDSISVPGYTENGGQKTPGSIDVEVFADEAGDEYNIGKTKFTIPGFKGQEQYASFSAESKTEMTGGFVGTQNTISEESLANNSKDLQGEITDKILAKISSQEADNYTYVYAPENFTFLQPKQTNAQGGKVEVSLTGTAYIYVIPTNVLSAKIAEKEISDYSGDPVLIENIDQVSIKLVTSDVADESEEVIQSNELLEVQGNANIVWQNDVEKIKSDIASKDKKMLADVLKNYSGVSKVEATISPFWDSTFPSDPDKIQVIIIK